MSCPHRILITGGSGYLGGTLLARWSEAHLPPTMYDKLFALVRTDAQAQAVQQLYGAEPLVFHPQEEASVREAIVGNKITIVYYLIDAVHSGPQVHMIKALAEVKKLTGQQVHFLHTTGAKIFSSHAGAPTDRPLMDTDPELYSIQKRQKAPFDLMQEAVNTNCIVIEEAERHGVHSYIFAPCIVYGAGQGFGNQISIQTVAIVKSALAMRRVYKVDEGAPTWPVCHILDTTTLYFAILRQILHGQDPGHGAHGYFLAASGSVAWDDLYAAVAAALAERHVVGDDSVVPAAGNRSILVQMGEALGCPPEMVPVQLGGACTLTAERGRRIGWTPRFEARHIVETAAEEVQLIMDHLKQTGTA